MASRPFIKSGSNNTCRDIRVRLTVRSAAGHNSTQRQYWTSRYDGNYQPSRIYKHHAVYPRLLRLRPTSEDKNCCQTPKPFVRLRVTRASSSWRDPTENGRRREWTEAQEEYDRFKQELKKDKAKFNKEWEESKREAREFWQKWIEEDPYRALFGPSETRGLVNPWEAFYKWRDGETSRNTSTDSSITQPTPTPGKDSSRAVNPKNDEQIQETLPQQTARITQEEFIIDPITMKKVPKPRPEKSQITSTLESAHKAKVHTKADSFKPTIEMSHSAPKMSDLGKEEISALKSPEAKTTSPKPAGVQLAGFASQPWLVRERFMPTTETSDKPNQLISAAIRRMQASQRSRMEQSLDRIASRPRVRQSDLEYTAAENKTEDIDLLRASDVRAASGRLRRPPTVSVDGATQRRSELEGDFNKAQQKHSAEIRSVLSPRSRLEKAKPEVANAGQLSSSSNGASKLSLEQSTTSLSARSEASSVKEVGLRDFDKDRAFQDLYNTLKQHVESSTDLLKAAKERILDRRLANEVSSCRQAFDKFENQKKHFPTTSTTAILSNNSWKQKIMQQTAWQRAREADLVREIRKIYEDRYGIINAKHKQEAPKTGTQSLETDEKSLTQKTSDQELKKHSSDPIPTSTEAHQEAFLLASTPVVDLPLDLQAEETTSPAGKTTSQPEKTTSQPGTTTLQPEKTTSRSESAASQLESVRSRQTSLRDFISALSSATNGQTPEPGIISPLVKESESNVQNKGDVMETVEPEAVSYSYRVLAMDRTRQEVMIAKTTSSIHQKSSPPRSASDILTHLDQPYKYFEFMDNLESEGYQLAAGARNMLVYRKPVELRPDAAGADTKSQSDPQLSQPAQSACTSAEASNEVEELANALKPWREESVFSGKASPKERFVRAYERSNSSRSAAEESIAAQDRLSEALHAQKSNKQPSRRGRARSAIAKLLGDFFRSLGVISGIIILLYAIGRYQDGGARAWSGEREAELERKRKRQVGESGWPTR